MGVAGDRGVDREERGRRGGAAADKYEQKKINEK